MIIPVRIAAAAVLMSAIACTGIAADWPVTSVLPGTPDLSPTPEPNPDSGLPAAGRLAIIDENANLTVLLRAAPPLAITEDGLPLDRTFKGRVYLHPTWSPDGWLSYVRAENLEGAAPRLDVLAVRPGETEPVTLLTTGSDNYLYGYWSPAVCASGDACGRFAFLMNEKDTIALHLAQVSRDSAAAVQEDVLARARPFYYSWAPDGEAMLWFRNGTSLGVYDIASGEVLRTLPERPGLFQAPAWSPIDQRLLFASMDRASSRLLVVDVNGEGRHEIGQPVRGPLFFSWSPDGRRIAYASGEFPLSPVTIVPASGDEPLTLDEVGEVVAFFWSPDSKQLAIAAVEPYRAPLPEAAASTGRGRRIAQTADPQFVLAWWVADTQTGTMVRLSEFFPTAEQLYMLQFFDQYAQSHRLWSPDSRHLVYAEQLPGEDSGMIQLLDTQRPDEAPLTLAPGRLAVFSFDE